MSKSYNKDFINSINIAEYVQRAGNRQVIIWGTGKIGKNVYEILSDANVPVYGFIDSNMEGSDYQCYGMKVL